MTEMLDFCADLPVDSVGAGHPILEEGSQPGRMFVLGSGWVTVERDDVVFAWIDIPGAIFGEMSIVLGKPATATVRADFDAEVHVIDDPQAFLTERPGAALEVLRTTASRLEGLTEYLVEVKRQFAEYEVHLGMVDPILNILVHHQGAPARIGSAREPEGGPSGLIT